MKTHRYQIRREDAQAFKRKLEKEPGFLSELTGMFSSSGPRKNNPPLLEPTEENRRAFATYLEECFQDWSDALTTWQAADMTALKLQYISCLCAKKRIDCTMVKSTTVKNKSYCSKESLVCYLSSAEVILGKNKPDKFKALIRNFVNSEN